ncbi:Sedlin [Blastocladiella britannica]|nr:Sedlin [Blastocladiella britannica]
MTTRAPQPPPRGPAGIAGIAIIGKMNNPLLVHAFPAPAAGYTAADMELKLHFLSHVALDYVDERLRLPSAPNDAYLGLLATLDGLNIYGYLTNTQNKFLILVPASIPAKDAEVRAAFEVIHLAYMDLLANAFYDPDAVQTVSSPRLLERLASLGPSS